GDPEPEAGRWFHDLGTGESDHVEPVLPRDLSQVKTVDDLVRGLSRTAFGGRRAGEAADVLEAMARDPECAVVLTISGAMTIAKMGLLVCDMVQRGLVHSVIATGALLTHASVAPARIAHSKYDPPMDD